MRCRLQWTVRLVEFQSRAGRGWPLPKSDLSAPTLGSMGRSSPEPGLSGQISLWPTAQPPHSSFTRIGCTKCPMRILFSGPIARGYFPGHRLLVRWKRRDPSDRTSPWEHQIGTEPCTAVVQCRAAETGPSLPVVRGSTADAIGGGVAEDRQFAAQCPQLKYVLTQRSSLAIDAPDPHRPGCRRLTLVLPFGFQWFSHVKIQCGSASYPQWQLPIQVRLRSVFEMGHLRTRAAQYAVHRKKTRDPRSRHSLVVRRRRIGRRRQCLELKELRRFTSAQTRRRISLAI
jgi:hypothetical protein